MGCPDKYLLMSLRRANLYGARRVMAVPMTRTRFLFACVGNAARSQMAEGFTLAWGDPERVEVRSGGTNPAGVVSRRAVAAMREVGIDISDHTSKPLDLDYARDADVFVTLCGPLDTACPRAIAEKAVDWDLPDPIHADEQTMRKVRDEIALRVKALLSEHGLLRTGVSVER